MLHTTIQRYIYCAILHLIASINAPNCAVKIQGKYKRNDDTKCREVYSIKVVYGN